AYGTARDLVIGMTAVMADGQVVKSGGRVVKNVAGYDLAKLHIGALGTLGVIAQVSFKVAPLPPRTEVLTYAGPLEALTALAFALRAAGLAVNGLMLEGAGEESRLSVRVAGSSAAVERSWRDVAALAVKHDLQPAETG